MTSRQCCQTEPPPDRPTPNRPPRRSAPRWLKNRHHAVRRRSGRQERRKDAKQARGCHRRMAPPRRATRRKPPPQPRARRQRSLSPRPQPRPALRGAPMASSEACRREANACRRRSKGSRAHNRPLDEAEQAPVRSGASRERLAAAASLPLPRNPPRHARPRERPEAAATRENGTRTPCRVWLDLDLSAPVKTRVPPAVHEAPATARRARTANARRGGQTSKRKAPRGRRVKSRASKRRRPQAARRERRAAQRE